MQGKNKCLNREMEVYIKLKDSEKTVLSRTAADKAVRQKRQGGGCSLSRRLTYSDSFSGEADREIRAILKEDIDDSEELTGKLKRTMLKVIKNELTPRQKEIIMLYYFKDMDIVHIAGLLEITPQAVSSAMKRARLKIYRYLQYYIN